MSDAPKIRALEEFGRQLDGVVPPRRQRRRRLVVGAALTAALFAAPALAVSTDLFDFGGDIARPGEPGGPPAVVTAPEAKTLNVLSVLLAPNGTAALKAAVEPYGLRVRVRERPVAPVAAGRIFGVQFPRNARFDPRRRLVLERGSSGTIIVTIGRTATGAEKPSTAGLSLFEVLPQVEAAVRRDDPRGTLARLRTQGFEVTVKLVIDNPDTGAAAVTGVKTVTTPPDGSIVLSVLNAEAENAATPNTKSLILEVAPANSRVARDHP